MFRPLETRGGVGMSVTTLRLFFLAIAVLAIVLVGFLIATR